MTRPRLVNEDAASLKILIITYIEVAISGPLRLSVGSQLRDGGEKERNWIPTLC